MISGSRCNFLFKTEARSNILTSNKALATATNDSMYKKLHSSFVIKRATPNITPVSQQNQGRGYSFPDHPARIPRVRLGQQLSPQPETEANGVIMKVIC